MRILRVGISNRGFTLLELILVIFILGLVVATVFPKISNFSGTNLKQSTRRLIRTVELVMNRATSTKRLYRLNYDLDNQEYWATVLVPGGEFVPVDSTISRRTRLREPIKIEDVETLRHGRINVGEAFTQFYPSGMVERTLLHLTKGDEDTLTLIIQPMTGRVKVLEGYVEEQRIY